MLQKLLYDCDLPTRNYVPSRQDCLGVVYYDSIGYLIADILEKAHIQGADMWTLARELRTMKVDRLGTEVIYYFPGVKFDHNAPQPEKV
jgi:hypothetical protein